jgi:pyruvate dehydrogenase E2 component (dihydrolipoamide acetyltransferase)
MSDLKIISIPDIGGASGVDVIEILVKKGDKITKDTPLVTLESDKASMEIPSPAAGIVDSIKIKLGDKVSEGDDILTFQPEEFSAVTEIFKPEPVETEESTQQTSEVTSTPTVVARDESPNLAQDTEDDEKEDGVVSRIFAGPGVRRIAHEFGVNLTDVHGSGRKSRITKEDMQQYIKSRIKQTTNSSGFVTPDAPVIDFSQFGLVEIKPLNKIKCLTGKNLHRAWITIPHVTQFDEADITELEVFRKAETSKLTDYKLTVLAFVCKVVAKALYAFPQFNASLDTKGEHLIYKHYVNIGVAVDTPNGLVVPVIKAVNQISIIEIAKEMSRLSQKAREKTLTPNDMAGGCFTISSLGGIGGTAFTPIVNYPEVAILGLSRAVIKPIYINEEFKPRLMLPLSLSYDHRVIDGAEAARFTRFLVEHLADIRRLLL